MEKNNLRSRTKVAWVAALLEGEGCFTISYKASTNKTFYPTFWISCNMCDEDVLEKLHLYTNKMGHFSGPFHNGNPKHRQFWRWRLGTRKNVGKLCKIIAPYMGKRRSEKIKVILETLKYSGKKPWQHGSKYAHDIIKCKCVICRMSHNKRFRERRKHAEKK